MNSGVTEEVGLTARTLVEAFKSSPALLSIVVFNVIFIGVVGYLSHENHNRWERESQRFQNLVERTMQICSTGMKLQSDDSRPIDLGTPK